MSDTECGSENSSDATLWRNDLLFDFWQSIRIWWFTLIGSWWRRGKGDFFFVSKITILFTSPGRTSTWESLGKSGIIPTWALGFNLLTQLPTFLTNGVILVFPHSSATLALLFETPVFSKYSFHHRSKLQTYIPSTVIGPPSSAQLLGAQASLMHKSAKELQ